MKKLSPDFRSFLNDMRMVIYKESKNEYGKEAIMGWTVEDWIPYRIIDTPPEFHKLPNFKLAQEVKNSGLMRALEEDNE